MSLPLKCEGGDTDPDPVTRLKHQKNPMSEAEVTAESGGGGGEEAEKGLSEDSSGSASFLRYVKLQRARPWSSGHLKSDDSKGLKADPNIRPQSTSPFCGSPHRGSLKPPLCSVQDDADSENTNISRSTFFRSNEGRQQARRTIYKALSMANTDSKNLNFNIKGTVGTRVAAAVKTFDNAHRDSSSESCSSDNKQWPASFPFYVRRQQARPRSPVFSVGSMQTDDSMDRDVNFREADTDMRTQQAGPRSGVSSVGSMQTDDSKDLDNNFRDTDTDISADANQALPQDTRCCVCSKTVSLKSCLTCCTSYCGDHVKHHYTSPDLQKHTLVEAGDLKKRLCERHHRVLEMFCATDQTAICTLCMFDHNGHNIYPFTDNESHQSTNVKGPVNKDLPAPGPIRFTSVTSDSVSLGWGGPDGQVGPQRFRVVWGCGGDQRSLQVDGLSVDVEGLDPGKDYNFSVVTLSDDGTQSPCVSASVQTEVPQPQNLTVITDSSSASVTWTKPKGLDQASFSISLYAGNECLKTIIKDSQECSFDLQPDSDYTVAISTVLKNGRKSKSICKSISINIPVPDNLKTSSVTATSATLAWSLSPSEEEAEPHSFLISYHSQGSEPLTVSSDSCSKVITVLKPHTQYTTVSTKIQNGGESQPATLTITTGANQESFFQELGLLKHQKKKLTLNSVLKISHNSVYIQSCECMQDLPLYFLRKRMWCNASSSCASVFDRKTGVSGKVNPLDLTTALFHCSDPFLQQTLCSKMSQCQLAVPLLLPNCDTQQSTLMLWAMRDIVKKFRPYHLEDPKSSVECRIATTPMPLVSFVRLGKGKSSISKSSWLNNIFGPSQQYNNTFVHYNMECGNIQRKISDGLVEMSWYLPSGIKNIDVFQQPIAFANLRGDIRMFETQFSFLCQTSAAVFVFTDDSEKDVSILTKRDRTSQLCLVIPEQTSQPETDGLAEVAGNIKDVNVIIKGNQNDAEFITTLRSHTADIVQKQKSLKPVKSVEAMSEIARKTGLLVDENCSECDEGQKLAKDILTGITDISQFKAEVLPCQGQMWKEISCLEREKCQLKKLGQGDIEQYKSDLNKLVNNLRAKQGVTELSKCITNFIDGISKKQIERSYFLKSLRMFLDSLTQNKMADLKDKYKTTLKQCPKKKEEVERLEKEISQCSLGLEHFFRELGQLYESASHSPDTSRAKQLQHLPHVCAQLLLEGFPLELLDGDASNIPLRWIEDIFNRLKNLVKDKCVISVVTVLGVQSTGKSTLLNTMFGVQFAVSSGKCTRGAFMQLVKVSDSSRRELKCDFILVIDTEGLKSPELAQQVDSYVHDNELATLVIGLSDVTIINVSMENATEMKDILQIVVHALLRMKEVGKKPRCLFVHQNVADVAAHDSNVWDRKKLIKQLNEMTNAAARMERKDVNTCFTDVMDYDPEKDTYYIPGLWQGTPPMASVSAGYSEAVYELKKGLINVLKGIRTNKHDLFQFCTLTKELWQAVRFENFIFNFRNSLVAEAYSKLCQEWNRWDWEFQKEMYNWSLTAEARISNCGITDPDSEIPSLSKLMLEASQKLNEEEENIQSSLQHYFDNQTSSMCLIEKYRAEFEISVKSLRRKTEASLESSLKAALDVQNWKKRLRMINIIQSQTIETKVLHLLKFCKGKEYDICDDILRKEFDNMWTKTKSEFPHYELPKKDVATDAFRILQTNFRTFPGHIQKLLIEENLPECGKTPFKVNKILGDKRQGNEPKLKRTALLTNLQDISENVIKAGENLIFTKTKQNEHYKPEHLQQLLHTIDEELQRHEIKFDEELEASLKMHIFGIATREFQKLHNDFIDKNDPQKCLEQAKEKFLLEFVNLYHDQDQCYGKAGEFAKNCLEPAILDNVMKRIGPEIVDEMKTGHHAVSLSTRSSFQYRLLSELLENHKYEDYKKFINCYETFVKDWLFQQVVQTMTKDNILQQKEKALIDGVLKKIIGAVTSLKHNPSMVSNGMEFITHICSRVDLILPDDAVGDFMIMNSTFHERTKEFADHLEGHIKDMLQSLNIQYEDTEDIKQRLQSLPLKPQEVLFEALFGCGKQCPFCRAPCEAGGGEHKEHFASIHRPQGTGSWHNTDTKVLLTDICSSSVISTRTFWSKETEGKKQFCKDYRKFYPEWNIPGDSTIEATAYWKFFMANFNDQIAQDRGLKPAIIPDDWKALTKDDALKSLQTAFHKSTPF